MSLRMGPLEIGIILVIILIVFGVGKLPQVGDALGRGIRSFRKAQSGEDEKDETKGEAPKEETPATTAVAEEKPKAEVKEEPKGGDTGEA
ncbi:MAG: twin-arginine translocase TatA/TatE family subunit [Dehalococcoidales bacterium]